MTHWHILTLKPGKGAFVYARLEAHGFELYWPMHSCWLLKRGTRKRETVLRPTIPGYMFSRTSGQIWATERISSGYAVPMMTGDGPVAIPDAELDPLRAVIAETPADQAYHVKEFARGEMLRILNGPFTGISGQADGMRDAQTVRIVSTKWPGPVLADVANVEQIG